VCDITISVPLTESGQPTLSNAQRHITKRCWLKEAENNAKKTPRNLLDIFKK
jgi:hypothetical protein